MLALSPVASLGMEVSVSSSLSFDAEAAKNRPVSKVITLLKDMLKQLEKEAEEDEEIYDKMACWCETNDKEKTKAIADAEARIADLTTKIEELTANSARLNTEIKNLEKEVAANQAALDQATSIRQKQLAEFNAEEKDLLESISALKSAIIVLSKHHGGSLLQMPRSHISGVAASLQHELQKHSAILDGVLSHSERKAISAFIQAPQDYFDAEPTFKQSYAPQSGQIFGILKQMKETFETNLSASQKEEMQAQAAYEDLKAAKEAEIKAGTELKDTKKQDLEDTRNSLSADQKFLMNLKETCQMTDQEWEERQKSRAEEIKAVSEALAILSSDDAHDTFTKTFNFVQVRTRARATRARDSASKMLFTAAKKYSNPRLAALATRVRLDAFTKVKAAIDEMIAALLKEKADEIKHKDFCTEGLNTNERETELKQRDIAELEAKISDLTTQIDELTKAIATLESEIAEMQTQLKRAGEDREMENKDFQTTVADQRATKELLNKALNVLKPIFDKKFLQLGAKVGQPAGPPPPPGFKEYKQSAGAGGVMGMMEQIIRDTEALEAEAIKAETDAQKAYESYVKDTNKSIEEKTRSITEKTQEKADADADKVAAEEAKETAMNEAQQLANENADLHKSCDFTLKNFDIRQEARDQEVEALRQAKAILSGAK